jgi:hypothetical protein
MIDEATKAGMLWDEAAVKIQPSANGIEHDECKHGIFRFASKNQRLLDKTAPLHPSVKERLELTAVTKCDMTGPYRPKALCNHVACAYYYEADDLMTAFGSSAIAEAQKRSTANADEANKMPDGF